MTEQPEESGQPEQNQRERLDESVPTPDRLLHTGAERPVDPEDLVQLMGRDVTPERVARARKMLDEQGAAAVERYLP